MRIWFEVNIVLSHLIQIYIHTHTRLTKDIGVFVWYFQLNFLICFILSILILG